MQYVQIEKLIRYVVLMQPAEYSYSRIEAI